MVPISNLIKLSSDSNLIQGFVAAPVRCIYIEYHREEILGEQWGDTGVQREDTWSKRVDSRVRRGDI